jgi:hypothetical protein
MRKEMGEGGSRGSLMKRSLRVGGGLFLDTSENFRVHLLSEGP